MEWSIGCTGILSLIRPKWKPDQVVTTKKGIELKLKLKFVVVVFFVSLFVCFVLFYWCTCFAPRHCDFIVSSWEVVGSGIK